MRHIVTLILAVFFVAANVSAVYAEDENASQFDQWIAPLECTRSEVVDGIAINTILSPIACDEFLTNNTSPENSSDVPQRGALRREVLDSSQLPEISQTIHQPTTSQGTKHLDISDHLGVSRLPKLSESGVLHQLFYSFITILLGVLALALSLFIIQFSFLTDLQKVIFFASIKRRVSSFRNRKTK